MTYFDPKTPTGSPVSAPALRDSTTSFPLNAASNDTSDQVVICGDALAVLKSMCDGSVDAVVTSPPYNVGLGYRSYDDCRPRNAYLDWMGEIAAEVARILTDDGSAFINIGAGSDPWQATDVALQFRKHLVLQNTISWIKSVAVSGVTSGHVRPVNSTRYLNRSHEHVLHFTRQGDVPVDRLAIGVPYKDKANLRRWKGVSDDRRCGGNVWYVPYETVRKSPGEPRHPAPFPLELPRRCLKLHGGTGLVLDPFLDSGTTLVAAKSLGWRGVGIEIDPVYVEAARWRIAEAEGPEGG